MREIGKKIQVILRFEKRIWYYLMSISIVKTFNILWRQNIEFFTVYIILLVANFKVTFDMRVYLDNYGIVAIVFSNIQHISQRYNVANIIGGFVKLHVNKAVLADR